MHDGSINGVSRVLERRISVKRLLIALAAAGSILVATGGQALAFDCTVANKPTGAGSAVTINVDTGDVTANKPNPGTD
jgi:hypothetical protein